MHIGFLAGINSKLLEKIQELRRISRVILLGEVTTLIAAAMVAATRFNVSVCRCCSLAAVPNDLVTEAKFLHLEDRPPWQLTTGH